MYKITVSNRQSDRQIELDLPVPYYSLELALQEIGYEHPEQDKYINVISFMNDVDSVPRLDPRIIDVCDIFALDRTCLKINSLNEEQKLLLEKFVHAKELDDLDSLNETIDHIAAGQYMIVENADTCEDLGKWFLGNDTYDEFLEDCIDFALVGDKFRRKVHGFHDEGTYIYIDKEKEARAVDRKYPGYDDKTIAVIRARDSELYLPAGTLTLEKFEQANPEFKTDVENIILLGVPVRGVESLKDFNVLCQRIYENAAEYDLDKMRGIMEYVLTVDNGFNEILREQPPINILIYIHSKIGDYDYFPDIHVPEDYGRWLVNEHQEYGELNQTILNALNYAEVADNFFSEHDRSSGYAYTPFGLVIDETPSVEEKLGNYWNEAVARFDEPEIEME